VALREADVFSRVVVLARPRGRHFWAEVAFVVVAFFEARKTSLNWFIPALVKSSVDPMRNERRACARAGALGLKEAQEGSRISLPLQDFSLLPARVTSGSTPKKFSW